MAEQCGFDGCPWHETHVMDSTLDKARRRGFGALRFFIRGANKGCDLTAVIEAEARYFGRFSWLPGRDVFWEFQPAVYIFAII